MPLTPPSASNTPAGAFERLLTIMNDLRANCPCALCVSELTGERLLDTKRIPADINPTEILPLGNQGNNFASTGHTLTPGL